MAYIGGERRQPKNHRHVCQRVGAKHYNQNKSRGKNLSENSRFWRDVAEAPEKLKGKIVRLEIEKDGKAESLDLESEDQKLEWYEPLLQNKKSFLMKEAFFNIPLFDWVFSHVRKGSSFA